jgi:hypothetical protein
MRGHTCTASSREHAAGYAAEWVVLGAAVCAAAGVAVASSTSVSSGYDSWGASVVMLVEALG